MGCIMALAYSEGMLWQAHTQQLQSHIEALTAWEVGAMFGAEPPMLVAHILMNCGWLLNEMRADKKLFMLIRTSFTRLGLDWATVKKS